MEKVFKEKSKNIRVYIAIETITDPYEKNVVNKPLTDHVLVPLHRVMKEEEKKELLKKYNIKLRQLPKISSKDPVLKLLNDVKPGDVLEIERNSITAGKVNYYRVVLND